MNKEFSLLEKTHVFFIPRWFKATYGLAALDNLVSCSCLGHNNENDSEAEARVCIQEGADC